MSTITIDRIRVYAYHGVFEVEQKIGQWYEVSLLISCDTSLAEQTDDIAGTIDYSVINNIVIDKMQIKSKLIEHVGARITNAIKNKFPQITNGTLTIVKLNPPVKGVLNSVKIELSF